MNDQFHIEKNAHFKLEIFLKIDSSYVYKYQTCKLNIVYNKY